MTALRQELSGFLDRRFPGNRCHELAGDASTRRFFRVETGDETCIVMDYGAAFDGETDDVRLTRVFEQAQLPVPAILEVAAEAGCLVLEDLGDRLLQSALAQDPGPHEEAPPVLQRAVLLAAAIADRGSDALKRSARADGPALDVERFRFEMGFFIEHYVQGWRGLVGLPAQLERELHDLADGAAQTPRRVLCHRDFHGRNLLLRADGSLAMVDLQDARWGPDSYDLASLLFDAYLEIDPGWVDPLIEIYLASLVDPPSAGDFGRRFRQVAVQRMIKALGTFGYQLHVRGDRRYRPAVPRTLCRLDRLMPTLTETRELHRTLTETGLFDATQLDDDGVS